MSTIEAAPTAAAGPAQGDAAAQRGGNGKARPRRPTARGRGGLVAALDIGTTKICCFIARVDGEQPRIVGIGHQISRGVRQGAIIDMEQAEMAVLSTVHAAEQMAEETISDVVVFTVPEGVDIKAAQYFRLKLPCGAIGREGWFRLELPRSMLSL